MFDIEADAVSNSKGWLGFCGIMLIILGALAAFGMWHGQFMGMVRMSLVLSSFLIILHSFKFWAKKWFGFSLHFLAGVIYFAMALLVEQIQYLYVMVVVVGISYFTMGIFRVVLAERQCDAQNGWGWTELAGIINLILSGLLFYGFSWNALLFASSADLVFTGFALLMLDKGANVI